MTTEAHHVEAGLDHIPQTGLVQVEAGLTAGILGVIARAVDEATSDEYGAYVQATGGTSVGVGVEIQLGTTVGAQVTALSDTEGAQVRALSDTEGA